MEKNNIVLDLSCRKKILEDNTQKYFVVIDRWQTFTDLEVSVDTLQFLAKYCDEFLIHGVDVEGKRQGIDKNLLEIISQFQEAPLTYAGGIKSNEDIAMIESFNKGNLHFTVGSSLDIFGGDMKYQNLTTL